MRVSIKLIDKDRVVAEIERRLEEYRTYPDYQIDSNYMELCDILSFLDTLEVKEVDINKEIEKELDSQRWRGEYIDTKKFRESAKHFFELGMCIRQVFPRFYKTSRFEKEVCDEPECKIFPRPIECDSTCKECPWLATNNKAQKGE